MQPQLKRAIVAVLLIAGVETAMPRFGRAHQTPCLHCKLDVVQDTGQQDNEVALRYGRKRLEYRCVSCALSEAKSEFENDLTILAPSEIKGKPVLISRKNGQWSVLPETAVFVGRKLDHSCCYVGNRAFTHRAAFDAYLKKNQTLLRQARPLTLDQMVAGAPY